MSAAPLDVFTFDRPLPYRPAFAAMERRVQARIENRVGDALFLLEHEPVITLGVRGREEHVRASTEELQTRGIDRVAVNRGGEVTLHAPGQWVLYPILKLTGAEASAAGHVRRLEEIALRTAGDFGVSAFRRRGLTGIWTAGGKLGAIGVRFRRWVSYHGLSLNVDLDLSLFDLIVPCGQPQEPVTSFRALLGSAAPDRTAVRARLLARAEELFHRPLRERPVVSAWPE